MRKIVREAWIEAVTNEVAREFPQFNLKPVRQVDFGALRFVWHTRPSLWIYLIFRPFEDEAFDVFVGWSTKENLPLARLFDSKPEDINNFSANHFFTWTMNYVPREGLSYWKFWQPPEEALDDPELFSKLDSNHFSKELSLDEALSLVQPSVQSAIREIMQYCIPYLEKRIQFEDERERSPGGMK